MPRELVQYDYKFRLIEGPGDMLNKQAKVVLFVHGGHKQAQKHPNTKDPALVNRRPRLLGQGA